MKRTNPQTDEELIEKMDLIDSQINEMPILEKDVIHSPTNEEKIEENGVVGPQTNEVQIGVQEVVDSQTNENRTEKEWPRTFCDDPGIPEATPIDPCEHFTEWISLSSAVFKITAERGDVVDIYNDIQKECLRFFMRHRDWYRGQDTVDLFTNKIRFDCIRFNTAYYSFYYPFYSNKNTLDAVSSFETMFKDSDGPERNTIFHNNPCGFVEIDKSCGENYANLFINDSIYQELFDALPNNSGGINNKLMEDLKANLCATEIVDPILLQWKYRIIAYIDRILEINNMSQSPALSAIEVMVLGYALSRVLLPQGSTTIENIKDFIHTLTGYSMHTLGDAGKRLNKPFYDYNFPKTGDPKKIKKRKDAGEKPERYIQAVENITNCIKLLNGGDEPEDGPGWNRLRKLLKEVECD